MPLRELGHRADRSIVVLYRLGVVSQFGTSVGSQRVNPVRVWVEIHKPGISLYCILIFTPLIMPIPRDEIVVLAECNGICDTVARSKAVCI